MNCNEVRDMLSAYMDGQIDGAKLLAIEGHIAECGACKEELRSLQAVAASLKGLATVKAPAGFENRLKERINARPKSFFDILPLSIKIPAGITALAITAVIAVYVYKSEQAATPLIMEKKPETAAVAPAANNMQDKLAKAERALPPAPAPKQKAAKVTHPVQAKRTLKRANSEQQVEQEPVLIALYIRQAAAPAAPAAGASRGAISSQDAASEMTAKKSAPAARLRSYNEPAAEKPSEDRQGSTNTLDSALSKIVDLLPELGAKAATPPGQHTLTIDIPLDNYTIFLSKLQAIGQFKQPPPPTQGAETIRVQIVIASE
ncbi:MAG: zf-HC2 domain-containing protein [Candidatus Magnetominusculus sp. LBB02]|nr:zf-HC2 domain-containing protein [Candidatus Magnetominusculus sp. LBB02]